MYLNQVIKYIEIYKSCLYKDRSLMGNDIGSGKRRLF